MTKKMALGRGLGAIIDQADTRHSGTDSIPLSQIVANPDQPRTEFDPVALQELADSIKEYGVIQPITVRKLSENQYQIISGERRFRASQLAGKTDILAHVRETDDEDMLLLALIENIQRMDLDPIEEALSYQRLMEESNLTHDKVSEKVGKTRSTITNALRLLRLPVEVQAALKAGLISSGHARTLLGVEDFQRQIELLHKIQEEAWSVRQTEAAVKNLNSPPTLSEPVQPISSEVVENVPSVSPIKPIVYNAYAGEEEEGETLTEETDSGIEYDPRTGEVIIPEGDINTGEEGTYSPIPSYPDRPPKPRVENRSTSSGTAAKRFNVQRNPSGVGGRFSFYFQDDNELNAFLDLAESILKNNSQA